MDAAENMAKAIRYDREQVERAIQQALGNKRYIDQQAAQEEATLEFWISVKCVCDDFHSDKIVPETVKELAVE